MNKHHFHTLLSRYKSDDCTEQEKRLVEQWFALLDEPTRENALAKNQQLEDRIWHAIQHTQRPESEYKQPVSLFRWRWVAAAAILMAVLWGGYQFKGSRPFQPGLASRIPADLIHKTNQTAKQLTFFLADGSEISLAPGSSLQYPANFENNNREVFLKGKAFFQVAKDAKKPFLVYTGEVATKVLGTSFWINHNEGNNDVEVSVMTGKVSVFARSDNPLDHLENLVILTPNQKVNYSPLTKAFITSLSSAPVMLPAYEKAFAFDDIPLPKVLQVIEKAYGINIIIENEKLNTCLVTADIGRLPMFTKLDLICSSINAHYKVEGTKILVSGKGCL